jgi:rubredoxin
MIEDTELHPCSPDFTRCYNGIMKKYLCLGCGFLYDEARGLPEHGIAPGTRWADIPDDWVCPDCSTPKSGFEMVEIPYWQEGART